MKNYNFTIKSCDPSDASEGYQITLSSNNGQFSVTQIREELKKQLSLTSIAILLNKEIQAHDNVLTEEAVKNVTFGAEHFVLVTYHDSEGKWLRYSPITTVLEAKQQLLDIMALPIENILISTALCSKVFDDNKYLATYINTSNWSRSIQLYTTTNVTLEASKQISAIDSNKSTSMAQEDSNTHNCTLTINLLLLDKSTRKYAISTSYRESISDIKAKIASKVKLLPEQIGIYSSDKELEDMTEVGLLYWNRKPKYSETLSIFIKKRVIFKGAQNEKTDMYFPGFATVLEMKASLARMQGKDHDALVFSLKHSDSEDRMLCDNQELVQLEIERYEGTIRWIAHPVAYISRLPDAHVKKIIYTEATQIKSLIEQYCQGQSMRVDDYAWSVNGTILSSTELQQYVDISCKSITIQAVRISDTLKEQLKGTEACHLI